MTSRSSLWRNRDFMKFWAGDTVSQFGNQITLLALPLTAVLTLKANALQMGILNAASYLPYAAASLFIGVWVDRIRRRPVMIVSALSRALILVVIVVFARAHMLRIDYLYGGALVLGAFTVLFDVAYEAYLPSLIDRDALVEGNSRLGVSASAAQVSGPALSGWLARLFTAPMALLADAGSFVVAAAALVAIRKPEPRPARTGGERRLRREMWVGIQFTFGNRVIRACVLEAATYNVFWLVLETVFLLYATHDLRMSSSEIGLVLSGGAVGALAGSMVTGRLSARLGAGGAISLAMVVGCAAPVLIPLSGGPRPLLFAILTISYFFGGAGTAVANIQVTSLWQAMAPSDMLGRINASYRFVAIGVVPIGALLGGVLGDEAGLRPTLFVAAAGIFAASLWIVFSPIRTMRQVPEIQRAQEPHNAAERTG
ncbi:MAG: MFS transporter [Trebonia sp.]